MGGASQSSSLSGSKECLAEDSSSRAAISSRSLRRPSASCRAPRSVTVVMASDTSLIGLPAVNSYETACQQDRQSPAHDLLTPRLPTCDAANHPVLYGSTRAEGASVSTHELYTKDPGAGVWQV